MSVFIKNKWGFECNTQGKSESIERRTKIVGSGLFMGFAGRKKNIDSVNNCKWYQGFSNME